MASTMRFDTWENPTATKTVTIDQIAGGSGLVPVVPTSIDVGSGTGTVGANGIVTFTGATSVSLNGVFSSGYKNYKLIYNATASASTSTSYLALRMRSARADDSSANYYRMGTRVLTNGTTAAYSAGTETYFNVIDSAYNVTFASIEIAFPFVADATRFTNASGSQSNGGVPVSVISAGQLGTASSYDGITAFSTVGGTTFTGQVQVYGYR